MILIIANVCLSMRNGYAVAPGIGNKKESFLIIAEEIINLVSVKCTRL